METIIIKDAEHSFAAANKDGSLIDEQNLGRNPLDNSISMEVESIISAGSGQTNEACITRISLGHATLILASTM